MIHQFATEQLLRQLAKLEYGELTLTTPDGQTRTFSGKSHEEGQPPDKASVVLHDWRVVTNLLRTGDIGLAEDYRRGRWDTDDLAALTAIGLRNRQALDRVVSGGLLGRALAALGYLFRANSVKGSRQNILAHYDVGNDFYQLWLDKSMTYSSAIFNRADEDLFTAQQNKYDRIINAFDKNSGSILEIGCGWGGFAERALTRTGADFSITGLTISKAQFAYAQKRLAHLKNQAHICLEDYRHQRGRFDHIVSIEMFEAVGEHYWKTYFNQVAALLHRSGKAMIQTITIADKQFASYRKGADFIRSFIFPGGMLPSPERFRAVSKACGLAVRDEFFFGHDYAKTLSLWLQQFDAQREKVRSLGFDEGFIRLWRFYLAACIAGFRTGHTNVMQVALSHDKT